MVRESEYKEMDQCTFHPEVHTVPHSTYAFRNSLAASLACHTAYYQTGKTKHQTPLGAVSIFSYPHRVLHPAKTILMNHTMTVIRT